MFEVECDSVWMTCARQFHTNPCILSTQVLTWCLCSKQCRKCLLCGWANFLRKLTFATVYDYFFYLETTMVIYSELHTVTTVLCLFEYNKQPKYGWNNIHMYNLSYLLILREPIYVILLHLHLIHACVPRFCVHFRVTFCLMVHNNFEHGLKKTFLR